MKARKLQVLVLGFLMLSLAACTPNAAISTAADQTGRGAQQAVSGAQQAVSNVQQAVNNAQQAIRSHLPGASPSNLAGGSTLSAQSAIQMVIVKGDLEQEQAIASHDSSVMKDTSTASYYQQAAQQNQDLLNNGVTAIKLTGLQWGSVTINGNSATATTDETWSTTYADGTNDQSTDRNVYTVVRQNGDWKIQADDQPGNVPGTAQASPSPNAGASPSASPGGSRRPAPSASGSASSPPQSSASPLTIAAPSGSTEAAIQQVILKGNSEQEQAISSRDSAVMKDTSTTAYYQDLSQTNQDMLDSGVTAIKLLKIEWGPVTVKGTTATATTVETWSTNYSDGSTDQSRDRNVYTLVQQNGSWKVQADDHPDQGLTTVPGTSPGNPSASGSPGTSPQPGPGSPLGRGQSSNWSGYAATGGSFTSVTGTWTIPQPAAGVGLGADAAWVGIGGERSRDLIQAGTEETVLSSGRVQYDAWIEMLPQYSHPIPLTVHPGDSVTVTIAKQQDGSWQIDFKNNTTGEKYNRSVQYTSSLSSAEWIEEAPSGGRGGVLPLDNFGSLTFSSASATKDGKTVNVSQAGSDPITMINRSGQTLVTTSAISKDGSSFTVTRTTNSAAVSGRRSATSPGSLFGG